jgi:hypothetical protein
LLSSSFDFSVCFWKIEADYNADENETNGNFVVESTLGAMVGNKHAFFGALFLQDSQNILAYTYGGAIH